MIKARKPPTQQETLLEALIQAAQAVGVEVRTERLQGAGGVPVASGLALVEENWVVFLEKRQPAKERLAALVEALARFDLSAVPLPPEAADYLARRRPLGRQSPP